MSARITKISIFSLILITGIFSIFQITNASCTGCAVAIRQCPTESVEAPYTPSALITGGMCQEDTECIRSDPCSIDYDAYEAGNIKYRLYKHIDSEKRELIQFSSPAQKIPKQKPISCDCQCKDDNGKDCVIGQKESVTAYAYPIIEPGTYTISFSAFSLYDCNNSCTFTVIDDTTPPVCQIDYPDGWITTDAFNVTLTESDDDSGIKSGNVDIKSKHKDSTWPAWSDYTEHPDHPNITTDFSHTGDNCHFYQFRYQVEDNAGNLSQGCSDGTPSTGFCWEGKITKIDKVPPTADISY
ncbi:MAG: hypothetical protein GF387_03565, partial [Candidatus Portnoybacteria bacterium]|nr:hypothetical protein [Candidatus Portnoybacteria bacterium]